MQFATPAEAERKAAYVRQHNIGEHIEAMVAALLDEQPEDPLLFMESWLRKRLGEDVAPK